MNIKYYILGLGIGNKRRKYRFPNFLLQIYLNINAYNALKYIYLMHLGIYLEDPGDIPMMILKDTRNINT